ncbi:hypothetical protein HAX54_041196 [Datura stramonium]|uniref:F-box associated beta-propeller type 3 domain-containing protein n=1 Tax=Datura stramonium TaxID=4076 RepID=A0ABS8SL10_DATST|nr:hypothetical protein [Datura stramonium]
MLSIIDKSRGDTKSISPDIVYCMASVCINGVIYRFANEANKRAIAAFDIKFENFNIIASWNSSESHHHWEGGNYRMIEVKGNLAVADCENWLIRGYIHLWIYLEEIKVEKEDEWKSHTIHFPSIWKGSI